MISPNDYQKFTDTTAVYPRDTVEQALSYTVLGLTNESGEVAGKVKKVLRRDKELTQEVKDAIADELGDAMYYLARTARELGYTLEDIMYMNILKLTDRQLRGVIKGDGDNR